MSKEKIDYDSEPTFASRYLAPMIESDVAALSAALNAKPGWVGDGLPVESIPVDSDLMYDMLECLNRGTSGKLWEAVDVYGVEPDLYDTDETTQEKDLAQDSIARWMKRKGLCLQPLPAPPAGAEQKENEP